MLKLPEPRILEAPQVLVGHGQTKRRFPMLRVQRQGTSVSGDRLLMALALAQEVPEKHVPLQDLLVLGERLADHRDGLVGAPFRRRRACLLQQVVEVDLVLGVAARPLGPWS